MEHCEAMESNSQNSQELSLNTGKVSESCESAESFAKLNDELGSANTVQMENEKMNINSVDVEHSQVEKIEVEDTTDKLETVGANIEEAVPSCSSQEPHQLNGPKEKADKGIFGMSVDSNKSVGGENKEVQEKIVGLNDENSDGMTEITDFGGALKSYTTDSEYRMIPEESDSSSGSDSDDSTSEEEKQAENIDKKVKSLDELNKKNSELSGKKKTEKGKFDSDSEIRTKGEIYPEELPPLDELIITVDPNVELVHTGNITSIVGVLVIVKSNQTIPPLNENTILFLEGRIVLGQIFEVFGPVGSPWYSVRFNSRDLIDKMGITTGQKVYCAPKVEKLTNYVFIEHLLQMKGSDASWEDNNEPPAKYLDYSDDEEERRAKAKARNHGNEEEGIHLPGARKHRRRNRNNRHSQEDAAKEGNEIDRYSGDEDGNDGDVRGQQMMGEQSNLQKKQERNNRRQRRRGENRGGQQGQKAYNSNTINAMNGNDSGVHGQNQNQTRVEYQTFQPFGASPRFPQPQTEIRNVRPYHSGPIRQASFRPNQYQQQQTWPNTPQNMQPSFTSNNMYNNLQYNQRPPVNFDVHNGPLIQRPQFQNNYRFHHETGNQFNNPGTCNSVPSFGNSGDHGGNFTNNGPAYNQLGNTYMPPRFGELNNFNAPPPGRFAMPNLSQPPPSFLPPTQFPQPMTDQRLIQNVSYQQGQEQNNHLQQWN